MELTTVQRTLMCCFQVYGIERDQVIDLMMVLRVAEAEDEMIEWVKQHRTATEDQVSEEVLRLLDKWKQHQTN